MKKFLFLFLLFFTFSFALEATGYGNSIESAKKNALNQLILQINANINSSVEINKQLKDNKVKKEAKTNLKISSFAFLKGVEYIVLPKKNDTYRVIAVLSDDAVNKNLMFLKDEVSIGLNTLSRNELKSLLQKVKFLESLSLVVNNKKVYSYAKKREREILKYLNMAKVIFILPKDSKLFIENQQYPANQVIFLPEGKYHYIIKKEGFLPVEGNFFADKYEMQKIKKTLVKKRNLKIALKTNLPAEMFESLFLNFHITVDKNSPLVFEYKVQKKLKTEIDGIKFYNVAVTLKVYNQGHLIIEKTAIMKNVTSDKINEKVRKAVFVLTKIALTKL